MNHYSTFCASIYLGRCATSRTVPGSIPGGVTGFFSDIFSSAQTMALGSTQPLMKTSTRNIPGGKGGRCVRLATYHHTVPLSRSLRALTFLDTSGPARPVTGMLFYMFGCRSWLLCGLRHSSAAARFLELLFRIPLRTWVFVPCVV